MWVDFQNLDHFVCFVYQANYNFYHTSQRGYTHVSNAHHMNIMCRATYALNIMHVMLLATGCMHVMLRPPHFMPHMITMWCLILPVTAACHATHHDTYDWYIMPQSMCTSCHNQLLYVMPHDNLHISSVRKHVFSNKYPWKCIPPFHPRNSTYYTISYKVF